MESKKPQLRYTKEQSIMVIRLLRFRNQDPRECKYTFMGLKDIAKHLGKSVAYVASICKKIKAGEASS